MGLMKEIGDAISLEYSYMNMRGSMRQVRHVGQRSIGAKRAFLEQIENTLAKLRAWNSAATGKV